MSHGVASEAVHEAAAGLPVEPRPVARPRFRRSWPERLVISGNIALVIACLVGAVGLTRYKQKFENIQRLQIPIGDGYVPDVKKDEPMNFLLVGVDTAQNIDHNSPILNDRPASSNTDTIMILRIDPKQEKAWLMSLPRDLYVQIPPDTRRYKINAAMSFGGGIPGGIGTLISTINQNFGIPVNHYAIVDLAGFERLVDLVGGVPVYFPWPARDQQSGFFQYDTGCITLRGEQALAYVRSRHFEAQVAGHWYDDSSSDLGRARRQQEFIRSAMQRAIDLTARNPFKMGELIDVAAGSATLDQYVTPGQLKAVAEQMRDFNAGTLEVYTPPVHREIIGKADVLILQDAEAKPMFDIFRGVAPGGDAQAQPSASPTSPPAAGLASTEAVTTSSQPALIPGPPDGVDCR